MSVELLLIPNTFPDGLDTTTRRTTVQGQILPFNTANALIKITAFSITANVVTFTAANALTVGGAQAILVAGFEGPFAFLNGGYTTASATATTITAPLTHANVPPTPVLGLATLSPNYTTGGIPLGGFINAQGQVFPIGTIGPVNQLNPVMFDAYSMNPATQTYEANYTTSPLQLAVFTSGAQATNADPVPADSIGFFAAYVKNAF